MPKVLQSSFLLGVMLGLGSTVQPASAGDHVHQHIDKLCRYLGAGYSFDGYHGHQHRRAEQHSFLPPASVGRRAPWLHAPKSHQPLVQPPMFEQPRHEQIVPWISPPLMVPQAGPQSGLPSWHEAPSAGESPLPTPTQEPSSRTPATAPELTPSRPEGGLLLLLNSTRESPKVGLPRNRYRQDNRDRAISVR